MINLDITIMFLKNNISNTTSNFHFVSFATNNCFDLRFFFSITQFSLLCSLNNIGNNLSNIELLRSMPKLFDSSPGTGTGNYSHNTGSHWYLGTSCFVDID